MLNFCITYEYGEIGTAYQSRLLNTALLYIKGSE
jgi:hypothetical protein